MKPIVFYNKKKENYYLVIKKLQGQVHLRLLTKAGLLTPTKLIVPVDHLKQFVQIRNCTMYQRVKFNKVEVDRIAFDDFVQFLNGEMLVKVRAGIKKKNVEEALRTVCNVSFSIFHLTKKQGETFVLDDILYKMETKTMQIAVKKSIIQYLQERFDMFEGCELENEQMLKEVELAKVVMSFSENHEPIRRAARKYMILATRVLQENEDEN